MYVQSVWTRSVHVGVNHQCKVCLVLRLLGSARTAPVRGTRAKLLYRVPRPGTPDCAPHSLNSTPRAQIFVVVLPGRCHEKVVADTLQVSGDDEVEDWVLQAIQTGLMEAKMDQMQRVVVISRCTNRVFGPAQWKVGVCPPSPVH